MYVRKLITAFFEHDPLHSWQEEGMSTKACLGFRVSGLGFRV
jgi:hypothetical protein